MVDSLRRERTGPTVALAAFYSEYKKDPKSFYAFVEGSNDPSYYRTVINNNLSEGDSITLYPCNGKKNVKYAFDQIRSRDYDKSKITYFIDRDISDLVEDENIIHDDFVYITDNYSIENDFLSSETLANVFRDVLGYSQVSKEDMDEIKKQFDMLRNSFENIMLPIMATIIYWRRTGIESPTYNNLNIKKIISINKTTTNFTIPEPLKELYKDSNVSYEEHNCETVENIITDINKISSPRKILRGKYLSEFFLISCNYLHKETKTRFKITNKKILNQRDIWDTVAPRSQPPKSLIKFIRNKIR